MKAWLGGWILYGWESSYKTSVYWETIAQSLCYWGPAATSFPVTPFKGKRLVIAMHLRNDLDSDSSLEKVPFLTAGVNVRATGTWVGH